METFEENFDQTGTVTTGDAMSNLDNKDEDSVVNRFEKEILHDGDRYVTKLPFKPKHDSLPDNFAVSKRRLLTTRRKLEAGGILHQYDKVIKDYEKDGIMLREFQTSIGVM